MKNNLYRSITTLMAFLILFSSTGFTLVEHQCKMRGRSVQVVTHIKPEDPGKKAGTCCAKSKLSKTGKGTYFKRAACCKENHQFEKLDVATSGTVSVAKIIKAFPAEITWFATSFQFLRAQWNIPSAPDSPDISFSSRLHGRGMRSFIQSFLI